MSIARVILAASVSMWISSAQSAPTGWMCQGDTCFLEESVHVSKGKMIVYMTDIETKDEGWVGLDCVRNLIVIPDREIDFVAGSAADSACEMWVRK